MPDGRVLIVGGGLIGLSCAWFLRRAGADVVVVEAGERTGGGASRGNAGAICPSMTEPLPAPGMIGEVLANLRRSDAALYVHPRAAPSLAGFVARFAAAATHRRFEGGLAAMASLARGVIPAYDELAAAGIGSHARHDGYLFAHADPDAAVDERAHIARMSSLGLCAEPGEVLGGSALRDAEPALGPAAIAGFVLPGERWVEPSVFVDELTEASIASGVAIRTGTGAVRIDTFEDGVEVLLAGGERVDVAEVVVAAGAWTPSLIGRLGVHLPVVPGKGYSFEVRPHVMPRRVIHLSSAHVVVSPAGERVRIAGTMEFDGTFDRFREGRVGAIVRVAQGFLDMDLTARRDEWVGPRPMTPDGLPYLGRVPGHERVVVAAGHNMLGLTLAPVTGRAIAGLIMAADPGLDLSPFALDR
jgi:D-amino-acid dehydrogenase